MAAIASQLVLHPLITSTLKVSSTTVGRDKLYRTIQYAARFLAWFCLRQGYSKETVARLLALKSTLGLSRKLMRIGKPLEHAQAAVKTFTISDPVLKYTALGRQLGYAGYLVNDMLIWLHTAKVYTFAPTTIAAINKRAATFWMTGILFSIVSSTYKLKNLSSRAQACKRVGASEKEESRRGEVKAVKTQQAAVKYQLVQDSLDILLPSGTLGFHNLDDGVLGLVGTVSSIMGLRTQIEKVLGPK